MLHYDLVIIGGGVTGLSAAVEASNLKMKTLLVEQGFTLGGHTRFFNEGYVQSFVRKINNNYVDLLLNHSVVGVYDDLVLSIYDGNDFVKVQIKSILVSTGSYQKRISFPNNDMPNIYGYLTLLEMIKLHQVKAGNNVIIVGDEIHEMLIETLENSDINIVKIIDKTDLIEAYGDEVYQGITTKKGNFQSDFLIVSDGNLPHNEILRMLNCEMVFDQEEQSWFPKSVDYMTSIKGVFVAGNVKSFKNAEENVFDGSSAVKAIFNYLGEMHGKK